MGGEDHGWLNSSELLRDPLESARIYQRGFRNPPESSEIRGITTRRGRHGVGVRQWGCVAGRRFRASGGGFPWRESGVSRGERRPRSHTPRISNPMTLQRRNPMEKQLAARPEAKNPHIGGFGFAPARGFAGFIPRRRARLVRRAGS